MPAIPDGERLAALEARVTVLERSHAGLDSVIRDLDARLRDLTDRIWRVAVLLAGSGAVGAAAGAAVAQSLTGA